MKIKLLNNAFAALVLSVSCLTNIANAGIILALDNNNDTLVSIDTDSFVVSTIGALGTNVSFAGLAYDSNTDTVYMAGGRGNNNLYTVNQATGAANLVGSHGINDLFGLAFDSLNNTLYGSQFAGGSGLFSLNTSDGSSTTINASMGSPMGGLAYNSLTDMLVGINDGGGNLYNINRTNGTQTLLGNGGSLNDSGLAFDADKNLYWDVDYSGNLFSYDPTNNYARTTHLSGLGSFDGATYLNTTSVPVPEPSTLAIFALGMIGLASRRLKKES
jgi:hypothetical protein